MPANQTFGTAAVGMRPHALARGVSQTADNGYDLNGRLARGGGATYIWTSFGLPQAVYRGSSTTVLSYGPNHERVERQSGSIHTAYAGDLYERRLDAAGATQVFHIFAEGREVAQLERNSAAIETVRYPLTDALGTVSTVASVSGAMLNRFAFNPWGQRIGAANTNSVRHRFTGHESEDSLGLINMRGRMYDPNVGRFLTPDLITQAPSRAQGLNRYSYVFNNPSSNTDPSGYQTSLFPVSTPGSSHIGIPSGWQGTSFSPDFEGPVPGAGVPTSDIGGVSPGLSTGGYVAWGAAGLLVGVGTTLFAAAAMGALIVASPALGVLVGIAAFSWGITFLAHGIGTGHYSEVYGRFSTGDATGEDVFEVSAMAGGTIAGVVGGPASAGFGARGMTSFMARVGGRSISVDVAGTATIYRHDNGDAAGHFSILVRAADGSTMHTHQQPTSGGHTTIVNFVGDVAASYQSTNPPLTLPNASAAIRYQSSVIREPGGLYHGVNNSCATHCAQVMHAGGRVDVPTGRPMFVWWNRLMREQ